jgi:hypothetical protein
MRRYELGPNKQIKQVLWPYLRGEVHSGKKDFTFASKPYIIYKNSSVSFQNSTFTWVPSLVRSILPEDKLK